MSFFYIYLFRDSFFSLMKRFWLPCQQMKCVTETKLGGKISKLINQSLMMVENSKPIRIKKIMS